MRYLLVSLFFISLMSCTSEPKVQEDSSPNTWKGVLRMNDSTELPFLFTWDGHAMIIRNGEERIEIKDIEKVGDTTIFRLPVFLTGFHVMDKGDHWNGYWTKYDAEGSYKMPFYAQKGIGNRFEKTDEAPTDFPSRWKVELRTGTDNPKPAIGEFQLKENGIVHGTFITETGDYRFLEGVMSGNHLQLSGFDGTHAYYFDATYSDGELRGTHFSGLTYAQPWKAIPNDSFSLRDPSELTYLKEGSSGIQFEAPDAQSSEYIVFDKASPDGPTILQIMGSWCPNCMDETRYFTQLHEKYSNKGLTIIGITFERSADLNEAQVAIDRMIADLGINYTIAFGGKATGEAVSSLLPMIDNFMSYPTSIFIDKEGVVRLIHTGFSGPGTSAFEAYSAETESLIQEMLSE